MLTATALLCFGLAHSPSGIALGTPTRALAPAATRAEAPFRDITFDEAREAAQAEGKLLFIDFFTTWCAPCKKMDALTWTDLDVQVWLLRHAVAIKVDADADARTKSIYDVNYYPTLLFATADAAEVKRMQGFKSAEQFLLAARGLQSITKNLAEYQAAVEANPHDAKVRTALADRLVAEDRVREAFDHYLAALEMKSASEVRLRADIFERMRTLQSRFAGMRSGLKPLEEAAIARLSESGRASRDAVRDAVDVACMQQITNNQRKTRELFARLRDESAGEGMNRDLAKRAAAEALVPYVFDGYLSSRTISELEGFEAQIEKLFDHEFSRVYELELEFSSNDAAALLLHNAKTRAAERGTDIYGALLALGQKERAYDTAERVIQADPTTRGILGLIRSSRRINHPVDALHWAERGLEILPEEKTTTLKQMKAVLAREIERAQAPAK